MAGGEAIRRRCSWNYNVQQVLGLSQHGVSKRSMIDKRKPLRLVMKE